MKRISMIPLIVLGCMAVGGVIGLPQLAQSTNPKEVKLVGSELTHMSRSPGEHVMLEADTVSAPPPCLVGVRRIFPDGSQDSSSFVVPAGEVFILTDIDALIFEDVAWAVGDAISLNVVLNAPSAPLRTILSASEVLISEAANAGVTAVNSHSQSGALAGPGTTLCLGALWHRPGGGGSADVRSAHLQGYLIDE